MAGGYRGSEVRLGFVRPLDPVGRHLLAGGNVSWLEPELGEDFFHRNAIPAAPREPGLAVMETAAVLLGDSLVVHWRVGDHVLILPPKPKNVDGGSRLLRRAAEKADSAANARQ